MSSSRLVSIVIPAYKPDFFQAALSSAMRQNHDAIEILVCDDCPTDAIKHIVDQLSPGSRWPIRYLRNATPLGEAHNIAHGIRQAHGEYIKFLYDDDILVPDCTRLLFDALHKQPDITLAAGRRQRIDSQGNPLPDNLATLNPFGKNVALDGPDLVSFLAENPINFIGEPSSVMCRRKDVLPFGDDIMSLKKIPILGLGDMALYLKLLRQGNLALLARTLSLFRVSELQSSEALRNNLVSAREGHANHYRLTKELGWVRPHKKNNTVRIAPLSQRDNMLPIDLRRWFDRSTTATRNNFEVANWLEHRKLSTTQKSLLHNHLLAHDGGPAVAIVISDFNNQPEYVLKTLESLADSTPLLERLKVFILADYDRDAQTSLQSQLPWVAATLENRAEVVNQLLADNSQPWWMLVDAGSTFTPSGLLQAVMHLVDAPEACALFCDELQLDAENGARLVFHPDFSLDYLLANPSATSRHWLFNREQALAAGGFDPEYAHALELDLILRLIEHPQFTRFIHCCEPLIAGPCLPAQDNPNQAQALLRHLRSRGYGNCEIRSNKPGKYTINYSHMGQPMVSILITCEDQLKNLITCVESLLEKTSWPHYQILIADNASQDESTRQWLAAMDELRSDKIRILRHGQRLSQSALINSAARHAEGEYLLLLANDTSVIEPQWLHNLLNHGQRAEVGITGSKVVDLDGSILNAGIILGPNGSAIPVTDKQAATPSFAQRLDTEQNYSAVSGDCLLIRRSLFEQLEGLDEQLFAHHFNDIDLCLKTLNSGHLIVWTPHTTIVRHTARASVDAQTLSFATRALYHRWLHYLAWDPAYNKGLSLKDQEDKIQSDDELSWRPLIHRPLPVVLAQPIDRGTTGDRIAAPLRSLRSDARLDGIIAHAPLILPEIARLSPNLVVMQGTGNTTDAQQMELIKEHTHARVIYDLVDFPRSTEQGVDTLSLLEVRAVLRNNLVRADRVTVPTNNMAELLEGIHPDIQVMETRLSPEIWQPLQSRSRREGKPRVGWVGSHEQSADLQLLSGVIKALANKVDWVIMGPCSRWLRPFIHEVHTVADESLYPGLLVELDLDLAVLPAQPSPLHAHRYLTKLLELDACAIPVICSDTLDNLNLSVTRSINETSAWIQAIETRLEKAQKDSAKDTSKMTHLLDSAALEQWSRIWSAM